MSTPSPAEMPTWSTVFRDRLQVPDFGDSELGVPFCLAPIDAAQWHVDEFRAVGDDEWVLDASTETGLRASVTLRFFPDTRALECWGEITHRGSEVIPGISRALTFHVPLALGADYDQPWVRTVGGAPLSTYYPPRDFAPDDRQLMYRSRYPYQVLSARNGRTTFDNLPVMIIGDRDRTRGLSFMIEWAGLWSLSVGEHRRDRGDDPTRLRVQAGIWGLDLDIAPGESVPLPRVLVTAFDGDLEAGSRSLRRHIRAHVAPTLAGEEVVPPTSFNQWFAFGNDFTADLLIPAVDAAARAGIEYFCVDGGWFTGGFPEGIGNWDSVDPHKFPDGVETFADHVRKRGMKYGTWFEPEWAHVDSDLYREHPDWFWPTPPWSKTWEPGFDQQFQDAAYALMNFGLAEVRDWWVARIRRAYDEWGMRWIRWDFNHAPRPNWDDVPPGRVGRRQIDHVLGLYAVLDEIIAACPDLFIEQCASGGMRIELGLVRRGHSFWMNDITHHSDVVRGFQHGLNAILPGAYANTNLCQPRHDFTDYDFLSHALGGFGYSGRLWEASAAEFDRLAAAFAHFRSYRHLLLGDFAQPTGQPRRAGDHERVVFTEGVQQLVVDFNHDGRGSARFVIGATPTG